MIKKVQTTPAQNRLDHFQKQLRTDAQNDKSNRRHTNDVKRNIGSSVTRAKPYSFATPTKSNVEDNNKNKLIYSSTTPAIIAKQLQSMDKPKTPSSQRLLNGRTDTPKTPHSLRNISETATSVQSKTPAQSRLHQLQSSLYAEDKKSLSASSPESILFHSTSRLLFKNNGSICSTDAVATELLRKYKHSSDRINRLSKLGPESRAINKDLLSKKSPSKRLKDLQHNIIAESHNGDNDALLIVNKGKAKGTTLKVKTETMSPNQAPVGVDTTKKSIFSTITNFAKKFFGTVTGDRSNSVQGIVEDDIDMDSIKVEPAATSTLVPDQDDDNDVEMEWEPTPESDITEVTIKRVYFLIYSINITKYCFVDNNENAIGAKQFAKKL